MPEPALYHVQKAAEIELTEPVVDGFRGFRRAQMVGRHVGAVHTGMDLSALDPGGEVATHVHSTEQSFYVLAGTPELILDGRPHLLARDDCGLIPLGVPHAWRNPAGEDARWLVANAPAPRAAHGEDTFWTGEPLPPEAGEPLDIRDPRTRTFFRLGEGQMNVDNLKIGAKIDAPTVSSSMATALLAYTGIAVKMLVDERLGAVLHTMFMVEYQPGGVAHPHDHPLEEAYYMLDGEVEAMADGDVFTLGPGDIFWTGVGCVHSFEHKGEGRVRWIETQSPQPPANHSYRHNRDWDYLEDRLK